MPAYAGERPAPALVKLTARQELLLDCVWRQLDHRTIAFQLDTTPGTVPHLKKYLAQKFLCHVDELRTVAIQRKVTTWTARHKVSRAATAELMRLISGR